MATSRVVEQASVLSIALILARDASPTEYAVAAVLLTWLSAALTLSDLGTGLQILRSGEPGVPTVLLAPVKYSVCAGIFACGIGLLVGGSTGTLLSFGGAIWSLSAGVLISRAAALAAGHVRSLLRSAAFAAAAAVSVALVAPLSNVGVIAGIALTGKLAVELVMLWASITLTSTESRQPWLVFANQTLNYLGANLDFVVVGIVLGPAAFALYSLAFRISGGIYSVISHSVVRVGTVRLSELDDHERSAALKSWCWPLLGLGLVGAVVLAFSAPAVPLLLGGKWDGAVPLIRILALLLPIRLIHGLLGAAFLVQRADRTLLRFEAVRIGLSLVILLVASYGGVVSLSVAVVVMAAVVTVATAGLLQRSTTMHLSRWFPTEIDEFASERTPLR